MAVISSFKQQCPSCEAMISIKDSMVGKKVECTKCKDKFIAERPDDDDDDADEGRPAKKTTKVDSKKSTAVTSKAPSKPPGNKPRRDEDDDDTDDEDDKPKKKKKDAPQGGTRNVTLLLALAGVGVLILGIAGFFLLGPSGGGGGGGGIRPPKDGFAKDGDEEKDKKEVKPPPIIKPIDPQATVLTDAEVAKLTNLLPNETEHVFHLFSANAFHANSPLRDAVFNTPGAWNDVELRKLLGFSVMGIDDLICAEKYTFPSWRYTVVHFKDAIKEDELKAALNLKAAPPVDGQAWYQYQQAEGNPAFELLARFRFGVPNQLRMFDNRSDRPSFVRIHNSQTLIIGDETPVKAFLVAKGQFPVLSGKAPPPVNPPPVNPPPINPNPNPDPKLPPMPMPPMPMPPRGKTALNAPSEKPQFVNYPENDQAPVQVQPPIGGGGVEVQPTPNPNPNPNPQPIPNHQPTPNPQPNPASGGRDDTYLTIKQSLKSALDRMEARGPENKDKIIFSSATDMDAARVETNLPEFSGNIVRRPRQFWDVTLLLTERKPRIRVLGTTLLQRDALRFQFRNELTCSQELDAKEFQREMRERSAHTVARFIGRLVNLPPEREIKVITEDRKPPEVDPDPEKKQEEQKPQEITSSQIEVTQASTSVEFVMDLVLDNASLMSVHGISALAASSLRIELETAANIAIRHALALAGKTLPERGLPERAIPPGQYPAGAFKRVEAALRTDREPKNRISWMTSLLPYLGQQNLHSKIKYEQSWREPGNWLAGNTIVPQFLDPSYPDFTRQVRVGDLSLDFGATHYVGIAGVGLDAAGYKRGDPAIKHKLGVLGYDESVKLEDIVKARGLSNTIFMIQVPHDGATGVSPWIAGGGATLRGVPEKNSIAPFVLSTDKNGKSIQHNGKRGTYVLLTDGTVRFIDQNVSDDVFKAMCTVEGPNPEGFDLNANPSTPLVKPPTGKDASTPPVKTPDPVVPKVEPKVEPKKDPDKDAKQALQGVWTIKSGEAGGMPLPAEMAKRMIWTFNGDTLTIKGASAPDSEDACSYTLDTAKAPHHLDFSPADKSKATIGILELTGGDLRICYRNVASGLGRPTAFSSEPGSQLLFVVLTKKN